MSIGTRIRCAVVSLFLILVVLRYGPVDAVTLKSTCGVHRDVNTEAATTHSRVVADMISDLGDNCCVPVNELNQHELALFAEFMEAVPGGDVCPIWFIIVIDY